MKHLPSHDSGRRRYAVLHHTGVDSPHFDLLFEENEQADLVAFRLSRWPAQEDDIAIPLPPHRRIYLTYQGPISGNRGNVTRLEAGEVHLVHRNNQWRLTWNAPHHTMTLEPADPTEDERLYRVRIALPSATD